MSRKRVENEMRNIRLRKFREPRFSEKTTGIQRIKFKNSCFFKKNGFVIFITKIIPGVS